MTIKEKHDALIAYCVRCSKNLDAPPQAPIRLYIEDEQSAIDQCELKDRNELCFFIQSLDDQGYLKNQTTGAGVSFIITMAGFQAAEDLGV